MHVGNVPIVNVPVPRVPATDVADVAGVAPPVAKIIGVGVAPLVAHIWIVFDTAAPDGEHELPIDTLKLPVVVTPPALLPIAVLFDPVVNK